MNLKKTWKRVVCVLRGHKPLLILTAPEGAVLGMGAPIKIPIRIPGSVGVMFTVMCLRCGISLKYTTERYTYGR